MYKRILVPVDGSSTSNKALTAALQLAREVGAQVRVLHAIDELAYLTASEFSGAVFEIARENAQKVLQEAAAIAESAGVDADRKLVDQPGQRLGHTVRDEAIAWKADMIVVGTHGRRGIERVLLGSGAEQVIRAAPVPVLVVRADEDSGKN
ncbi:MAG TPA: universal stress protein [Ramlibacter sp.]|nr:universal stress protein [Ramlibacter sp.]